MERYIYRILIYLTTLIYSNQETQKMQHIIHYQKLDFPMSMTEGEARFEEWMDELYEEHKESALGEQVGERLKAFYLSQPLIAGKPLNALVEAKKLLQSHPSAAQVFAATAIEVGLKSILLKPVVHALVHNEPAAKIITDLALQRTRYDSLKKLLFQILSEQANVDLETHTRESKSKLVWQEIQETQKCRNQILHKAEKATKKQAEQAIAVAEEILDKFFPSVVTNLGLHLHEGVKICDDWKCKYPNLIDNCQ